MAKMTLLEIVQDILSDMDSDEVNSISDSLEAMQVAQIVKTSYFNILDGRDYPHLYHLFQLDSSGSGSFPNYMSVPDNVIDVEWIKYNKRKSTDTKDKYEEVKYKTPEEFVAILDQRNSDDVNITVITDDSGVTLNIYTNRAPTYFTSFNDVDVVFDSYDSSVDSTLQTSKTKCWGKVAKTWTMSDTFIPDLPVQMFSFLLNEAKAASFANVKQMANPRVEQLVQIHKRRMSQEAWKLKNGITYPNYGRK